MVVFALLLAAVYAIAAVGKVRHLEGLEDYVQPLTAAQSRRLVRLTILVEVILAGTLVSATIDHSISRVAGTASGAFIIVVTLFHALLVSTTQTTRCHCFGKDRSGRLDPAWAPAMFAARNAILLLASATVAGASVRIMVALPLAILLSLVIALLASSMRERRLLLAPSHPLATEFAPTMATLQAHSWWVNGRPRRF